MNLLEAKTKALKLINEWLDDDDHWDTSYDYGTMVLAKRCVEEAEHIDSVKCALFNAGFTAEQVGPDLSIANR